MWWLLAAGVGVLGLVLWQVARSWWEARGWPAGGRPLLMLLLRDCAEVVEGFLRSVLHRLGCEDACSGWDVVVLDAGSRDETPDIACRVLRGTGVPFLHHGTGWHRLVEEAAGGGRPVLLIPVLDAADTSRMQHRWPIRPLLLAGGPCYRMLDGKGRILPFHAELPG